MNTVMRRREKVRLRYQGKVKDGTTSFPANRAIKSTHHPMFGILKTEAEHPVEMVSKMRRTRSHDL
jgi:hypothetical protein